MIKKIGDKCNPISLIIKIGNMSNLLFIVSGLFVITWIVGFKGYYPIGGHITPLLIMALFAAIMGAFEYMSNFKRKVKEEKF